MAVGELETRAAELAKRLSGIFVEVDDVDVIAAAVVEALAPLAHMRHAIIADSYIDQAGSLRCAVEADCICVECRRPFGVASSRDLL
jgi:hypothetical protein